MNVINRLKKLEQRTNANGGDFCCCGTPYYASIGPHPESRINEFCADCQLPVKPQTIDEFIKHTAEHCDIHLILPKATDGESVGEDEQIPVTYGEFLDDCRKGANNEH